jgi:hypothetical protein
VTPYRPVYNKLIPSAPAYLMGGCHIHLRIHHWVLWWFGVGIVCGVVALVNIFSRDLAGAIYSGFAMVLTLAIPERIALLHGLGALCSRAISG